MCKYKCIFVFVILFLFFVVFSAFTNDIEIYSEKPYIVLGDTYYYNLNIDVEFSFEIERGHSLKVITNIDCLYILDLKEKSEKGNFIFDVFMKVQEHEIEIDPKLDDMEIIEFFELYDKNFLGIAQYTSEGSFISFEEQVSKEILEMGFEDDIFISILKGIFQYFPDEVSTNDSWTKTDSFKFSFIGSETINEEVPIELKYKLVGNNITNDNFKVNQIKVSGQTNDQQKGVVKNAGEYKIDYTIELSEKRLVDISTNWILERNIFTNYIVEMEVEGMHIITLEADVFKNIERLKESPDLF